MVGAAKRRHLNGSGGELDGRYTAIYRDTRAETTRKVGGKTVGRRREEKGSMRCMHTKHMSKTHFAVFFRSTHGNDTHCRVSYKCSR
jgi:hypothetical protein